MPEVECLAELNAGLRTACEGDLARRIAGRCETVGEALARERPLLRALPAEPFPSAEESLVRVDQKGLVCVRQNRYSVPVRLAGLRVRASVGARELRVLHDGACVARHERRRGRLGVSARLDHYLELLRRKPGALRGSLALHQEREAGSWPEIFDSLWRALEGGAVAVLARQNDRSAVEPLHDLPEGLAASERPEPSLAGYDVLIGGSR